jgi:hypothetical protein
MGTIPRGSLATVHRDSRNRSQIMANTIGVHFTMDVIFYKGVVKTSKDTEVRGAWARTAFGIIGLLERHSESLSRIKAETIVREEFVTSCDLEGCGPTETEFLIGRILRGKYLERPGVKDRGDAVLFLLLNEAIHRLAEIETDEKD